MTVRIDDRVIRLEGACYLEDAEALTALLQTAGPLSIDLSACTAMHGAVAQAILALRPDVVGMPQSPFMRNLLVPALTAPRREPASNL